MTPQDLKQIDKLLEKRFKDVALKKDLDESINKVINTLKVEIDEAVTIIIETVDKSKADKRDVKDLDKRVTKLERKIGLSTQ
jgi:septal ring factor EnvC (AmiA/AmiB activator)